MFYFVKCQTFWNVVVIWCFLLNHQQAIKSDVFDLLYWLITQKHFTTSQKLELDLKENIYYFFRKSCRLFFRKHNENVCFRNVFIQSSINLKITYILSLYRPDEDQYSKFVDNYQVFLKILVDFLFFSQRPLKNLFVAQYMKNLFFLMYREFFKKQKENVL